MATEEMSDSETELSILLIVTVVIGTILMVSLLLCYICVFKQLCCEGIEESKKRRQTSRKFDSQRHRDSIPLADITHGSSQPTEIERV